MPDRDNIQTQPHGIGSVTNKITEELQETTAILPNMPYRHIHTGMNTMSSRSLEYPYYLPSNDRFVMETGLIFAIQQPLSETDTSLGFGCQMKANFDNPHQVAFAYSNTVDDNTQISYMFPNANNGDPVVVQTDVDLNVAVLNEPYITNWNRIGIRFIFDGSSKFEVIVNGNIIHEDIGPTPSYVEGSGLIAETNRNPSIDGSNPINDNSFMIGGCEFIEYTP